MPADQRLTKVYSDQNYKFTTLVRHQGVVIAFAMDDRRRIYYAVLDLRESQADDTRTDADFWTQDPRRLCFPAEITDVGYAAAGNGLLPTVALGGRVETSPATLFPEEIDPFLSTTARLSADCPFFVYSDGAHVFLFRQAVGADHPDAVFRRQSGALSGDRARADLLRDAAGALLWDVIGEKPREPRATKRAGTACTCASVTGRHRLECALATSEAGPRKARRVWTWENARGLLG